MTTKKAAYIVTERNPETLAEEFKSLFFSLVAAEKYIATKSPYGKIKSYVEVEDGTAKEI
jgi:hypothetical protein